MNFKYSLIVLSAILVMLAITNYLALTFGHATHKGGGVSGPPLVPGGSSSKNSLSLSVDELNREVYRLKQIQMSNQLTSEMLYEELDQIKRALDALAELSSANNKGLSKLERLTADERS